MEVLSNQHIFLDIFFRVIPHQINTETNPSELKYFSLDCSPNGNNYSWQILLLIITRFLTAGIQDCQKIYWAQVILEKMA
jgi:hypothetical protein